MQNAKCILCLVPALFIFKSAIKEECSMNNCKYKNYDDLPLVLDAKTLQDFLGLSRSKVYKLMRERDFPAKHFGKRVVVSREEFLEWFKSYGGR